MVNWSPATPVGVRRMKIRPGIVMMSERRENQRRFPMMSNTPARLAPSRWPHGPHRDELLVAQAPQRWSSCPFLADDPAQDRAGHDDRAEHRDEDAQDQDEGEAPDHGRAERVQDRRGDEAR